MIVGMRGGEGVASGTGTQKQRDHGRTRSPGKRENHFRYSLTSLPVNGSRVDGYVKWELFPISLFCVKRFGEIAGRKTP